MYIKCFVARLCLVFGVEAFPTFSGGKTQPNILVILADDLGYADLSIQGCKQFQTPQIDSIAKNGARFKQGYVSNSVCAPSRAGLLSGRIGIGFEANLPHDSTHGLDTTVETMADVLKSVGYKTFCIGKWHLGYEPQFHPNKRGFDEFYGSLGGSRSYYALAETDQHTAIERNGVVEPDPKGSYVTDRLTKGAVDYIDAHAAANSKQPWFMYLSYTAPHGPFEAKPGYAERFPEIKDDERRNYAGMMVSLDEGVCQVLQCLERNTMQENTLVVFMSDNGGPPKGPALNGMFRRGKGSLFEGGVRVPFFMQWKGTILPGQEIDEPVINLDLLPTFATAAGVDKAIKTDGVDNMPLLGGGGSALEARGFYWRRGGMEQCGYREGRYKWLHNRRADQRLLFDVEADLFEKNNLLKTLPEVAERMETKFTALETGVPDPAFSSNWKAKNEKKKARLSP